MTNVVHLSIVHHAIFIILGMMRRELACKADGPTKTEK
jgi:hypothetical protein